MKLIDPPHLKICGVDQWGHSTRNLHFPDEYSCTPKFQELCLLIFVLSLSLSIYLSIYPSISNRGPHERICGYDVPRGCKICRALGRSIDIPLTAVWFRMEIHIVTNFLAELRTLNMLWTTCLAWHLNPGVRQGMTRDKARSSLSWCADTPSRTGVVRCFELSCLPNIAPYCPVMFKHLLNCNLRVSLMPLCYFNPLSKVEELIRCNVCNFVICRAVSGTTTKFLFVFRKVGASWHGFGIE